MQNWKKGYVFGHMTNFGKDMTDKIKKNACKNAYLGSIFIPEKYVFRVCSESPFTRMISNLKYKWPPRDFYTRALNFKQNLPKISHYLPKLLSFQANLGNVGIVLMKLGLFSVQFLKILKI